MTTALDRRLVYLGLSALGLLLLLGGCQHFGADEPDAEDLVPEPADTTEAPPDDEDDRTGKPEIIAENGIDELIERAEAAGEEIRPGKWLLDAMACREWVAWEVDIHECSVELEPHHEAMILTLAYDCTVDGCQQARWAVTSTHVHIRLLWADDSPTTVTPEIDSYFVGYLEGEPGLFGVDAGTATDAQGAEPEADDVEPAVDEPEEGEDDDTESTDVEPTLYRIQQATGQIDELASCVSPQISPDGQWVVCRDFDGRLLRVPVAGGEVEVLDAPDLGDRRVYVRPEEGIVPDKVWFVDDETVEYDLVTEGEQDDDTEVETRTVDWPG